ncbi:MBL fold metallo-hydrolase, partial [Corynebacterium diphtheriae]
RHRPDPRPRGPHRRRAVPAAPARRHPRDRLQAEASSSPRSTSPASTSILPDFDYIRDRVDDVVGIVLTHGHEDHIGAVPYLLRLRDDIPVIGSKL